MNGYHITAVTFASIGAFGCLFSTTWKDVALAAMLFGISIVFLFFGA